MAGDVKVVLTAVDKASTTINKVNKSFGGMKISMVDIWAAANLAQQGFQVLSDGINATVGKTVDYNKQIREMTQVTGLGAEEISRIVQVADDWGIEIGALRTSLGYMNKQGITPSIDKLAELADEYVNTTDKAKFAEKASKLLGRQYQTLIPLFAKGGDALREQADAIDESLIATDESIRASREYEIALDNLGDSVDGFSMAIGQRAIPSLVAFFDMLNKMINLEPETWFQDGADAAAEFINKVFYGIEPTEDLKGAIEALPTKPFEELEEAAGETATAIDTAKIALSNLQLALSGPMGKALEDFDKRQDELYIRLGEVDTQIAILNNKKYLTKDQRQELEDLKKEQQEIQGEIKKVGDEYDEATKRILIDIALQQAAMDGITTDAEVAAIKNLMDQWGLTDQATVDAQLQMTEYLNLINAGVPPAAAAIASGLTASLDDVESEAIRAKNKTDALIKSLEAINGKHYKAWIDIYQNIYSNDEFREQHQQHGGPVKGGMPYIVGEAGPELFVPPTSGKIIPNNQLRSAGGSAYGGGDIYATFYITPTSNQSPRAIAREVYNMLTEAQRHASAGGGYQGV